MTDPDYRAAVEAVSFLDRSARTRLLVTGRAPVRMLDGIVTGTVPRGPRESAPDVGAGRAEYSAVLTPKGRIVTDLRIFRTDPGGGAEPRGTGGVVGAPVALPGAGAGSERLLLDVPQAGADGLRQHFSRFLPPRFARVDDVSDRLGMLTLVGPEAAALISRDVLGLRVEEDELAGLEEGGYRSVDAGGGGDAVAVEEERITVVRTAEAAAPAFDVLADVATVRALARRFRGAGVAPLSDASWHVLRVEAGRPAFGIDMDVDTLPMEAGIDRRAIDHGKGCYTGQEVVVRIRDRGHVNRRLRGLRLGGAAVPDRGAEIHAPDVREGRPVGHVTSAARSPRFGETVALGWVRREVQPGASVRVGGPEGVEATVVELGEGGWAL